MKRMSLSHLGLLVILALMLVACQPVATEMAAEMPEGAEGPTASPEATAARTHTTQFDASKYAKVYVYTIEEIENDGRSLLHISYPVTEQDAINTRMEEVSQQFIDEYRATAAEIEAAYLEYKKDTGREAATFITHYRQSFDVSIANENVIFFDLERSIHTGGTGNSYVIGYIFDRRSGAELAIADLFVDASYLERLSDLIQGSIGRTDWQRGFSERLGLGRGRHRADSREFR